MEWAVHVTVYKLQKVNRHQPMYYIYTNEQMKTHTCNAITLTPSTPAVPNCCCSKCPAPYWSNPPFLIFDIRALWRSVVRARMSKTSASARSISRHIVPVDAQNSAIPGAIPQRGRKPVWDVAELLCKISRRSAKPRQRNPLPCKKRKPQ